MLALVEGDKDVDGLDDFDCEAEGLALLESDLLADVEGERDLLADVDGLSDGEGEATSSDGVIVQIAAVDVPVFR